MISYKKRRKNKREGYIYGYKKYDVVEANLNGAIESEQGGVRPVLVIQNNVGNLHSSTTIVMPFSTKLKNLNQPTHTLIRKDKENGLSVDSIILGKQMRVISYKRILRKLGSVTDTRQRDAICRVYEANFED